MAVLNKQYELIRETRESLFKYCETMSDEDYRRELETLGDKSIRNLHAHVAGCYQYWLGSFALKQHFHMVDPIDIHNVSEMRDLFKSVNQLVEEFLNQFSDKWDMLITGRIPRQKNEEQLTALWLLTHALTHEFHHKGQIVSIGRQLGYSPPDTDLIVPTLFK